MRVGLITKKAVESVMLSLILAVALAASPKAAPARETQLVIDVKPAQVVIYLDNKKVGAATKVYTLKVTPGSHNIKLVLNRDSSEDVVSVAKGEKKVWQFDMTDSGAPSQKPSPEEASQPETSPPDPTTAPEPPSSPPPETDPDLR